MSDITGPAPTVERDRFGRPMLIPPTGKKNATKRVAYTRATTVAETLDDRYNLERHKMRQVASGLAVRPDLVTLTAAKLDDKKALDKICEEATAAAKAGAAANMGTAAHSFIELINRGIEPKFIPADIAGDIEAYRAAMADWEVLAAELFVVLDDLMIAGTADMLMRERSTGRLVIGDLKTGAGATTYAQRSIAAQLAIYAHGTIYDIETDTRDVKPLDVDQHEAFVVHLPVGEKRCEIFTVDIAAGWEAVQHSLWARKWRNRNDLVTPYSGAVVASDFGPSAFDEISAAVTVPRLYEIYHAALANGYDKNDLVAACKRRKDELLPLEASA